MVLFLISTGQTANSKCCCLSQSREHSLYFAGCSSNTFSPNTTITGWCYWKIVEGKIQNTTKPLQSPALFLSLSFRFFVQLLLFMDPKIFMCIVAIALIHTCTQIKKRSFLSSFALRRNPPSGWLLHTVVSERETCICTRFSVKDFLIIVSLKVRECENYTLYYVPLEVIRWNKCDVHTVVFVVGKLQQKLKCRGRVSSITRVFTILIGK